MDGHMYEDLSKKLDKITDALDKLVAFQMLSCDDSALTKSASHDKKPKVLNMISDKRDAARKKLFGDDSE